MNGVPSYQPPRPAVCLGFRCQRPLCRCGNCHNPECRNFALHTEASEQPPVHVDGDTDHRLRRERGHLR